MRTVRADFSSCTHCSLPARARATEVEGRALAANPQVLRMREIEKWNGQCPLDSATCVIGAQALVQAGG